MYSNPCPSVASPGHARAISSVRLKSLSNSESLWPAESLTTSTPAGPTMATCRARARAHLHASQRTPVRLHLGSPPVRVGFGLNLKGTRRCPPSSAGSSRRPRRLSTWIQSKPLHVARRQVVGPRRSELAKLRRRQVENCSLPWNSTSGQIVWRLSPDSARPWPATMINAA